VLQAINRTLLRWKANERVKCRPSLKDKRHGEVQLGMTSNSEVKDSPRFFFWKKKKETHTSANVGILHAKTTEKRMTDQCAK
jgi:hypothetical protein